LAPDWQYVSTQPTAVMANDPKIANRRVVNMRAVHSLVQRACHHQMTSFLLENAVNGVPKGDG
jgi:hypothetical protein